MSEITVTTMSANVAPQSAYVMEAGQLAKVIKVIARQKVRIDAMIQTAAVHAVAQSIVYRNSTPAAQLYEAAGTSSRRDSLVKYFELFGNLAWSKGEKRVVFCDVEVVENKPKLVWSEDYSTKVHAYLWHKAKPEPKQVSMYDVEEKVASLIDSLRKAARKGITLDNAELLDEVEALYVKYAATSFDLKRTTAITDKAELKAAADAAKDAAAAESRVITDREMLVAQVKGGVQLAA
jgi:hypothetical protein